VAHSLRDTMARHVGSDLGLLKVDFKNAFNLVDRAAFMRASCSALPRLSKWTNWCYSNPSLLLYDHQHVFWSSSGVQQGDPLGPLYFCFGLRPLVDEISALNPVYNKWYMDDGGIVAPVPVLLGSGRSSLRRAPPSVSTSTRLSVSGRVSIPPLSAPPLSLACPLSQRTRCACWVSPRF